MSLTLWAKLIAGFLIVAAIGYSYKWTYDRGGDVREAQFKLDTAAMLAQALKDQEGAFQELRQREMREAAVIADSNQKNEVKKTSNLFKIIDDLKDKTCANEQLPVDVISLLNFNTSNPTK